MPDAEHARWLPILELVDMPLGQVICEPGAELSHAYFPCTAIVSLLYVMEDGKSAEIALVGNDGLVGVTCHSPWSGACPRRCRWPCRDAKCSFRVTAVDPDNASMDSGPESQDPRLLRRLLRAKDRIDAASHEAWPVERRLSRHRARACIAYRPLEVPTTLRRAASLTTTRGWRFEPAPRSSPKPGIATQPRSTAQRRNYCACVPVK
jgi:hypothetical protein